MGDVLLGVAMTFGGAVDICMEGVLLAWVLVRGIVTYSLKRASLGGIMKPGSERRTTLLSENLGHSMIFISTLIKIPMLCTAYSVGNAVLI